MALRALQDTGATFAAAHRTSLKQAHGRGAGQTQRTSLQHRGGASSVVVFHNHPSGDARPSEFDTLVTRRLVQAGELMGMDVMDHIILAGRSYYSFRKAGFL